MSMGCRLYCMLKAKTTKKPKATPPENRKEHYTVWHEIVLKPGDQFTIPPLTWHWFQGGDLRVR